MRIVRSRTISRGVGCKGFIRARAVVIDRAVAIVVVAIATLPIQAKAHTGHIGCAPYDTAIGIGGLEEYAYFLTGIRKGQRSPERRWQLQRIRGRVDRDVGRNAPE